MKGNVNLHKALFYLQLYPEFVSTIRDISKTRTGSSVSSFNLDIYGVYQYFERVATL